MSRVRAPSIALSFLFMELWHSFFLGLVQGITEFLPVSSSGHLSLVQHFLGFKDLHHFVLFNMICHLGTLSALFSLFFPHIKQTLKGGIKAWGPLCLGTLPLFPLALILKPIKAVFNHPEWLGPLFLLSAGLLFAGAYRRLPLSFIRPLSQGHHALMIGLFQAIAVLPGISRSGATISAARLLGWDHERAIRFSFLLAIPAILGGTLLEGWEVWKSPPSPFSSLPLASWPHLAIGFLVSYFVGLLSLCLLIRLSSHHKWHYFAWYCLGLGILTTFYIDFYASFI